MMAVNFSFVKELALWPVWVIYFYKNWRFHLFMVPKWRTDFGDPLNFYLVRKIHKIKYHSYQCKHSKHKEIKQKYIIQRAVQRVQRATTKHFNFFRQHYNYIRLWNQTLGLIQWISPIPLFSSSVLLLQPKQSTSMDRTRCGLSWTWEAWG